jgi:hypothetical protein
VREIKHLSVHQWLRSAIPDSQQPASPIGFLFSKRQHIPSLGRNVWRRLARGLSRVSGVGWKSERAAVQVERFRAGVFGDV